jgi:phosphoglycerol transferase MdoB-like AlkP superfamily enzyme
MNLKATGKKIYSIFWEKLPAFLNKTFEVSYTKTSKITGSVLCLVCIIGVILNINAFLKLSVSSRWVLMALDMFLPFAIALATIFTVRFKSEKARKIFGFVLLFLMPILFMTITECLNGVFVYDMTYLGFFANYIILLIFYFLIFAISGSFKFSYLFVNIPFFVLAFAHSYVMEFRGTPFQPMDFLSVTTAAGVANTYNFTPDHEITTALLLFILLFIIIIKTKTPEYKLPAKIISRGFTGAFSVVVLILFYFTSVFADLGVRPDFWNQTRGYHNYGFVWNFFANTKYLYMTEPNDYDPNEIGNIINKQEQDENPVINENAPNIICIMNESLSDLSVLGDFKTNKKYMPYLNSLKENTIRGNLYVPVIGAGTSNTEFEFLTGHTTAFLPSGSNAYMLYMDNPTSSMVSTLKAQGYKPTAFHPYYASGWNRTSVYSNFAFNKFIALESIIKPEIFPDYKQNGSDPDYLQGLVDKYYPGSNMLIRQYVSDSYNYDLLIKDFEKRDKSKPYFMFNVTMQNHGGYTTTALNFKEDVYLTENETEYPKVNEYLSLVKQSDKAFKKLINYFKTVEEPTIICMFGDHQPTIEPEFVEELLGAKSLSSLSAAQEQRRHMTPFYIWANYDIEEAEIDKMSANYLSSLVLKTAGVELTEYNRYLLKLYETLPVINTVGYIDNADNYYKWSDVSPYTDLISEYEKIQYNCIFDSKNLKTDTFYLKDYVHKPTELVEPGKEIKQ